jgi:hypothetical protein
MDSRVSHSWTIYCTTAISSVSIEMLIASKLMAISLDHSDTKEGFTYCKSVGEQHLSATETRTPNINKQAIVRKILILLTL